MMKTIKMGVGRSRPSRNGIASAYVTVEQAAASIGISDRQIYHAIADGELASIRIGKRKGLRIHVNDLRQWLESKRSAAAPPRRLRHDQIYRRPARKQLKYF